MTTILVIDDDFDFVEVTQIVLEGHGFKVVTATNPTAGLQLVKDADPDFVILDVMMPNGTEGFTVARAIREELRKTELPILLLSAIHSVKKVPYRFAPNETYLPVDRFLDKPVQPDQLVETVQRMLGEFREEPSSPL